jgi:HEAT repeat protein
MLMVLAGGCNGLFSASIPSVHPANARVEALEVLKKGSQSPNPFTRAHTIEALAATLGMQAGDVYEAGLRDEDPAVRYAAAVAAGDVRYAPAKERLLTMAADKTVETDRRVMPGAIYALYQLGNDEYAGQLGSLLFDAEQEVRANAAMAMGRMGEPSATGPLRSLQAQETEDRVRLSIFEAQALLGDEASAYRLEGYARTTFLDMRLAAITAMSQFPSPRGMAVMRQLSREKRNPPQVRVAAAGALARMGELDEAGLDLAIRSASRPRQALQKAYGKQEDVTEAQVDQLQQVTAVALSYMHRSESLDALYQLMQDDSADVRVAAAMGVLRLLPAPSSAQAEQPATAPQDQAQQAEQAVEIPTTAPDEPSEPAPETMPKLETSGAKE